MHINLNFNSNFGIGAGDTVDVGINFASRVFHILTVINIKVCWKKENTEIIIIIIVCTY